MPFAFWLARLCEEFQCVPSVAFREWWTAPAGLLEDLIEMRQYARTKAQIDHATDRKHQPEGALADLVRAIDFELAQQAIDATEL